MHLLSIMQHLDPTAPDGSILNSDRFMYAPLNCRAVMCRLSNRDPSSVIHEIECLIQRHNLGFFILADASPIADSARFDRFCEALVGRGLGIAWGIHACLSDVERHADQLPLYRQAGLIHVSMNPGQCMTADRINTRQVISKCHTVIDLLRRCGMVSELQFNVEAGDATFEQLHSLVHMTNEVGPDLVNWIVSPSGPAQPTLAREQVIAVVLNNYRRFYSQQAARDYAWDKDPFRRNYLRGCFKANLKSAVERLR